MKENLLKMIQPMLLHLDATIIMTVELMTLKFLYIDSLIK